MNESLLPAKNFYRREILLHLPAGSTFLYRSSNNMTMRDEPPPVFEPFGFDTEYNSDDVIVAGNLKKKEFVLAGAVTAFRSQTFFTLIKRASLMHAIEVRQPDIMEGETPEEVVVLKGDDWRKLLLEYAGILARKMNVRKPAAQENLTGYCTWYYYYTTVTEKNLLDNLESLRKYRDSGYRAQVVQIDDGYQTFQGDWNDQDASWPTPLPEIARRIADSGMTPGIWLMPFQASTASRVYREHPDWFVKEADGSPKVAKGWSPPPDDMWVCLDTTLPAVREHLANVFRTFRSWGFSYFKMDGLGFAMMEGKRSDPAATPVSALRIGLKAIREAVPDSFLLGCCPPFLACLGYVDSARISGDTCACGKSIRKSIRAVCARFWMYDRLFRCDPDVLIARQDRSTQTLSEARISVLGGILTGVSLTSDNFKTINPERLELLARGAKLRMHDVMPEGWTETSWPKIFTGTVDGKKAAAVINLDETDFECKFENLHFNPAQDAEELLHPMGSRKYVVTVRPHDAVLLVQD